jgi:hypothetical protein
MNFRKVFSFATLTLLVALSLSAIAAYYSIQGLIAIFAAAVIPIIIMGGSLELAKVVTTVWLHRYWNRAGWNLKLYLVPAVVALAFLTSMGIFGFLSKAHSDQTLVSGDVGAKVAVYDTKIQTAKENIDANRKALQQMDAQVDQLLGRTTDDKGANRAVSVRNQQKKERARIQAEIAADQETIAKLNEDAAPIRAQVRKVEAEVGPIKYIAALIYGDNPDSNLLERAVRWVIILIVFVFDPLALTLVLAAQSSYKWLEEDLKKREEEEEEDKFKETFSTNKLDEDTSKFLDEVLDDVLTETPYEVKEKPNVEIEIQPVVVEPVGELRPSELEIHDPSDDEIDGELPGQEEKIEGHIRGEARQPEAAPEIRTEGITLQETDTGYIKYQGKSVSKSALQEMHPELFIAKPDETLSNANFGIEFPKFAKKGDTFVRVDMLPNRAYKFGGDRWFEINKEQTLFDEEYIRHLITKLDSGEYDPELLSDNERDQIEEYLSKNS